MTTEIDRAEAKAELPQAVHETLRAVAKYRRNAEDLVARFESARAANAIMARDLSSSRAETARLADELAGTLAKNRDLVDEVAELKGSLAAACDENHRMVEGFNALLRAVQEANGAIVGIDQRIEAVLLSADVGVAAGQPQDVTPESARAFIAEVSAPAIR